MRFCTSLAAILLLASASPGAFAATASPEEAQRLTRVFQDYLGSTPDVVTVEPSGEAYAVKIDLAPLIAKAQATGVTASVSPIEFQISSLGGGKWQVSQDQPLSMTLSQPATLDLLIKVDKYKVNGVFDEAMGTFASNSSDVSGLAIDEKMNAPEAGGTHAAYSISTIHYEAANTLAGDGVVDGTFHVTFGSMAETIGIPTPTGATTFDLNVTSSGGSEDGKIEGVHSKALLQLLAWLVAHASPEAIKTGQAELKTLLRAALPVWQKLSGTGSLQNLAILTPVGPMSIANIGFELSMNGVVADGLLREKIAVTGVTPPSGVVPPWAQNLVPTSFAVDVGVSDFNLAAPAGIILDNFDLNNEPPLKPELDQQLQQAVMPKGTIAVTLGPSSIVSTAAELGAEGTMTAGPAEKFGGSANVKLKGFDEVMKVLQSAPPEMGLQNSMPVMVMAKGLAKAEADGSLSWKIESTPDNHVLINGTDLMKQ